MRTASLAGMMAVMKPVSMSVGQSMRMKSGQPCERAFSTFTSQVKALPPNQRGSLERGLEMQRSSKLDQHLSRTRAWSSEGEANVGGGGGLAHATLAGGDDSDAGGGAGESQRARACDSTGELVELWLLQEKREKREFKIHSLEDRI